MENQISTAMDKFHETASNTPSTDAATVITRMAATMPTSVAIAALARLYVITLAWARRGNPQ